MRSIRAERQKETDAYEITPDGRVKVNISKLIESPKVREFYASIRNAGEKEKLVKK